MGAAEMCVAAADEEAEEEGGAAEAAVTEGMEATVSEASASEERRSKAAAESRHHSVIETRPPESERGVCGAVSSTSPASAWKLLSVTIEAFLPSPSPSRSL